MPAQAFHFEGVLNPNQQQFQEDNKRFREKLAQLAQGTINMSLIALILNLHHTARNYNSRQQWSNGKGKSIHSAERG